MKEKRRVILLLVVVLVFNIVTATSFSGLNSKRRGADDCKPVVVAHRGASGYVPEHTLGAYALAITMGADYVEPDLVMTKDGHLISRHENELGHTSDVSQRPEFADRYRTQNVSGKTVTGWFSEDFTLAEIKTLRAIEPIPDIRPGNTRMDKAYDIPTFQEIIDLVKALEISENRTIGIYPELKYGLHFQNLGLAMEPKVVEVFHRNGYTKRNDPVYIQSFEVSNLKKLKQLTNLRLLQLYGALTARPFDQVELGTWLTYAQMATPKGLANVAEYASAVGPQKSYIIPRNLANNLSSPTNFVKDAHAVGLEVHPWTFRAENVYLPKEFQRGNSSIAFGDLESEIKAFLDAGVDGLFVDQPDILVRVRGQCSD
ncbi:glycerophosphodiester phosphodiesterase, periplasmic-like [Vanessa cardui]|uniref:glycerophosphodiester phosphodiesterase, periplasmic-like n=1 Tax=Vanessa cardui TaxID=171605 RepID=UPI001F13942F|nr:glycerophosphodiester phosphodiesterase, periplasmic-like [Vanessa cardui]